MNKLNKRLLITAIVVLVIGLATLIPSVLTTIPYMQQVIAKTELKQTQEVVEAVSTLVTKVVIDASDVSVRIETSPTEQFQVAIENSNVQKLEVDTELVDQTVKLTAKSTFDFPEITQDASKFVEEAVGAIFHEQAVTLIIQVPKSQAINLEIFSAGNVTIVDSDRLGEQTKISHTGQFAITNPTQPTSQKQLTYENVIDYSYGYYYGSTNLDYKLLNAFTDVVAKGDYLSISNQFYTEALTTNTLTVEGSNIAYEYVPFSGTVTLRDYSGLYLNFMSVPNVEWKIQTNQFEIFMAYGDEVMSNAPWQFSGHFWPSDEKQSGTLVLESNYISFYTQQTPQKLLDFAATQPQLEVLNTEDDNF
ncbi:MAG: hypothetical protein ACRC3J_09840 [Culicoidibacterales bacterium]